MRILYAAVATAVLAGGGCAKTADPEVRPANNAVTSPQTRSGEQPTRMSAEFTEFSKRVATYMQLHQKFESSLPKRPTEATPAEIDKHQRALATLIIAERKGAKRGDVITPEAERAIRAVLQQVFGGPDGKQLKSSIMDENPGDVRITVNSRYPDEVPLSTVPPQVLAALPKLPEDLEYRFVGDRLILLDLHAHIIVDYIDKALPA